MPIRKSRHGSEPETWMSTIFPSHQEVEIFRGLAVVEVGVAVVAAEGIKKRSEEKVAEEVVAEGEVVEEEKVAEEVAAEGEVVEEEKVAAEGEVVE